jgi:hypothetical protein
MDYTSTPVIVASVVLFFAVSVGLLFPLSLCLFLSWFSFEIIMEYLEFRIFRPPSEAPAKKPDPEAKAG